MNAAERVGEVLDDRYRLDQLIGRGAMADVYRAHDLQTDGAVAVKILRLALSLTNEGEAVRRFAREAHVQALVRHRNVAALYGSGVTSRGEPYLVVELLRGKSLRTVLKAEGRVPDEDLTTRMDEVRAEYDRQLDARFAGARGFVDEVVLPEELRPALGLLLRAGLQNPGPHVGPFQLAERV